MWRFLALSTTAAFLAAHEAPQARTVGSIGGGLPALDIVAGCKDIAKADPKQTLNFDRCMAEEKIARQQLQGAWASYPTSERTRCMGMVRQPALPSYVTLQGCLDIAKGIGTPKAGSAQIQ